jgi:uncharacterized membrane protein YkoI
MKRTLAITLAFAGTSVAFADPVDSADGVIDALKAAGYAEVRDVEHDDGLWEAEVRGPDGKFYDLHVVAATGAVLDARGDQPVLSADEIRAKLEAEGYTGVHDLDLDDAVWEAEATAPDGSRVDLLLNGFDGQVLASSVDD